jgi:hypothetical protein
VFVNPLSESVSPKSQPCGTAVSELDVRKAALSYESPHMALSRPKVVGGTSDI